MSRDLGQLFSRKEQKEMKKEMIKLKRKNKFIEKNCMISAAKLRKMIEKVKEPDLDNEISISRINQDLKVYRKNNKTGI